jgi:hypothetical protein
MHIPRHPNLYEIDLHFRRCLLRLLGYFDWKKQVVVNAARGQRTIPRQRESARNIASARRALPPLKFVSRTAPGRFKSPAGSSIRAVESRGDGSLGRCPRKPGTHFGKPNLLGVMLSAKSISASFVRRATTKPEGMSYAFTAPLSPLVRRSSNASPRHE